MKVRLGFVTNSSSSSFIFSKDSLGVQKISKETLFSWLKDIAEECKQLTLEMLQMANMYGITWDEDTEELYDDGRSVKDTYPETCNTQNLQRALNKKYGMSVADLQDACDDFIGTAYPNGTSWTKYASYAEYVANDILGSERVITIVDYNQIESDIKADGYDPYGACGDISWFKSESKDLKEKLAEQETLKNAALCLGDMAVHSENGWLPKMFVDKIREYCTLSCAHMG